ncbi:MAG: energy-coupling factor transporter transmembrane protein EcfT [Eubacterium sp.]|nr:energy-coupling factor transporter transmembrane protein EcfT [Eubacterium sp.]
MAYSAEAAQEKRRGFLDPRTKIAITVCLAVFVLGGLGGAEMEPVKTLLSALPFLLLLVERQWRRFLRGILMLLVGYGLLFLMPYLPGALQFIALLCGGILTRFVVTVVMGEYLIGTTSVSEFISAMERLHMPAAITIPMSVMFRLFPTIGAEWKSIRRAMGMRGIRLGGARAGQVLEYQMVPMITSSVRIGEDLSAAALTRGLGGPVKRTNICRIGFQVQDMILLLICLATVVIWLMSLCGVALWQY